MGKTKRSREEVLVAINGSHGVKRIIAERLGVARNTVNNYLDRWVTVQNAYDEEKAGVDDEAYSVVVDDIVKNRSVDTAKWWLVRKVEEFQDKGPSGREDDPLHIKYITENRPEDSVEREEDDDSTGD